MKIVQVTAPSYWAPYLINGDVSIFDYSNDIEDEMACYEFERNNGVCINAEELGFSVGNDAGTKACEISKYTFQVVK